MRVELQNVSKSFGENEILRGLNLVVPEKQLVCLIGGSGTGKSVTLKHIIGLIQPDTGRVLIDGQDVTDLSERDWMPIRRRFGMIFQDGGLLRSLTVGQNVALPLREHRLADPKEIPRIVSEKLKLVGLEGVEEQMPDRLSGGMRKRVSIARALTTDPQIILYDEPTAGLDPIRSDQIDKLINDLNNRLGVTSIVVTHDMISVFKIADQVCMLHEGAIIESGTPEQFKESQVPQVREFLKRDMHRL